MIALEGARNFRDLGGYETSDGRRVRWRRLFRSDALCDLTSADVGVLARTGIASIIDLRTECEVEAFGRVPLADDHGGASYLHIPFIPDVGAATRPHGAPRVEVSAERYLQMLERAKPAVGRVFAALAGEDAYAAVFHCTAGKDRTGMVAAIILATLGVPDDVIVEDYALTARYLVWDEARRQRLNDFYGVTVGDGAVRADPETMRDTLAGLRERYGSVEGYLADCGVPPDARAAVRRHLLEA